MGWADRTVEKRIETTATTVANSVSKSRGDSTLSTGIPCDAEACGTSTEEGERTATDSFTCTHVDAME